MSVTCLHFQNYSLYMKHLCRVFTLLMVCFLVAYSYQNWYFMLWNMSLSTYLNRIGCHSWITGQFIVDAWVQSQGSLFGLLWRKWHLGWFLCHNGLSLLCCQSASTSYSVYVAGTLGHGDLLLISLHCCCCSSTCLNVVGIN